VRTPPILLSNRGKDHGCPLLASAFVRNLGSSRAKSGRSQPSAAVRATASSTRVGRLAHRVGPSTTSTDDGVSATIEHVSEAAERIAARIPLSHFPSRATFHGDDGWPAWGSLVPPRERGTAEPADPHDLLRWNHVFLFAGPACYALGSGHLGDSVLYFAAGAEQNLDGHACPFDTGSCRPEPVGRLRPYCTRAAHDCLAFITERSTPIAGWREEMRRWLDACYDDPSEYLMSGKDRYASGAPLRSEPSDLLEHNGRRGHATYGGGCADRRAWTWEIRSLDAVGFNNLRAIHMANHLVDEAAFVRLDAIAAEHGVRPAVITIDPGRPVSAKALYRDSERVLRLFIEDKVPA
jgi:hypothetical protein